MQLTDMPQISNPEVAMYAHYLFDSVDSLLACLDGLDEQQLNWRPASESANSLYVLAVHVLANVEETVLMVLCGLPVARDRDAEFVAQGPTADTLRARWTSLRGRIWVQLASLPPGALDAEYDHPRRGRLTGRAVLLLTTRHAAEHKGHAELTRDLLTAARRYEVRGMRFDGLIGPPRWIAVRCSHMTYLVPRTSYLLPRTSYLALAPGVAGLLY